MRHIKVEATLSKDMKTVSIRVLEQTHRGNKFGVHRSNLFTHGSVVLRSLLNPCACIDLYDRKNYVCTLKAVKGCLTRTQYIYLLRGGLKLRQLLRHTMNDIKSRRFYLGGNYEQNNNGLQFYFSGI